MEQLLSEELLLAALVVRTNRTIAVTSSTVRFGLSGGLVMDLVLRGAATMDGRYLVAGTQPAGDPLLDRALEKVRSSGRPRDLKHWVMTLAKPPIGADVRQRLVDRGVLRPREDRVLGLFRVTRHELVDPGARERVVARVEAALLGAGSPDDRTASLVSLISACRLVGRVVPGSPRRDASRRAKAIAAGEVGARAVSGAIRAVESELSTAISEAINAAMVADSGSGHHSGGHHGGGHH